MRDIGLALWLAAILTLTFASIRGVGTMEPRLAAVPVQAAVVAQVGK